MFRINGNVIIDNSDVLHSQSFRINIGAKTNCVSFIQYLKPVTTENPFFYLKVNSQRSDSVITIGLASPEISDTVHTGYWNNTIGYESSTGRCICSHRINANTAGKPVSKDDIFGLMLSYYGIEQSTIVFFHNNEAVATRYHFETNREKFLPTITFENGPIEVEVYWPDCVDIIPFSFQRNSNKWAKSVGCVYNEKEGCFENISKAEDLPIQSAIALGKAYPHYKCTQIDVSPDGQGTSVGIASCSPLKPTPTCSLLRDYYTWLPKMKLKSGSNIGWGIFYNPNLTNAEDEINDKIEQLVLLFVTYNSTIVDVLFVLQPEGGFFPLALMQPWATKIKLDFDLYINDDDIEKLTKLFNSKYTPAVDIYNSYLVDTNIRNNDLELSSQDIQIKNYKNKTVISINSSGLPDTYYIQYKRPLTKERRFFFVEVNKLGAKSNCVIGVSSSIDLNNRLPGQLHNTVGYHSKSGSLLYNGKSHGNMIGKRYGKGDAVGLEIEVFEKDMSVVLFSKNFKPVGTRFLTAKNFDKFFPTIAVVSNGEPIELVVYWQNKVFVPPSYNVRNPEDWCLPEGTRVDLKDKCFYLPPHYDHSLCIQAPYSLHHKYNHFEIILVDDFDKNNPPPALALCTACPFDPPPISQFKQDYLRFWPHGDAMDSVKQNDRIGWGIFYPEEGNSTLQYNEQLVICYLTINRQVCYLRVLFQPAGGFYPVIIAPPNVSRIKLDFSATRVSTQDFTNEQVKQIIEDSRKQIEHEQKLIAQGINPRDDDKSIGGYSKQSKTCNLL